MTRRRAIRPGVGVVVLLCALLSACGSGSGSQSLSPPPSVNPCPGQGSFAWNGGYDALTVRFPAIPLGESPPYYDPSTLPQNFSGTILRPSDQAGSPGRRPAVVLQHGHNGSQCGLWYLARALAGAGYVALVYTQPYDAIPDTIGVDDDAIVSAIDFLGSPQNPYSQYTNPSLIGLVGYSEGSIAVSYSQDLPEASNVDAIVALDNLKHWQSGDPGAAGQSCIPPELYPVTPRVPALGLAMDAVCPYQPANDGPDIKESGWTWWRSNGVPAMELVMRGFAHETFADGTKGGTSAQLQNVAYFVEAWFQRWLNGDYSADSRLLACSVHGQGTAGLLSQTFLSGAYLTEAQADTDDYAADLAQRCN